MVIHIDLQPIKGCKYPELTYGEICVKCNACGRFDYGGDSNPVRSDIRVVIQGNDGYPNLWRHPKEFGGYYKGKECWFRSDKRITSGTTLEDIVSPHWYPERLEHVRWWIEGTNY